MEKVHVGDKLYSLVWEKDGSLSIWEEEIKHFRYNGFHKVAYYMTESSAYAPGEIGTNVFLNKAEARKHMSEMGTGV
ncbi:MAG: hypothetical protein WCQ54_14525 [Clostridiaceae bacterium]